MARIIRHKPTIDDVFFRKNVRHFHKCTGFTPRYMYAKPGIVKVYYQNFNKDRMMNLSSYWISIRDLLHRYQSVVFEMIERFTDYTVVLKPKKLSIKQKRRSKPIQTPAEKEQRRNNIIKGMEDKIRQTY